MNFDTSQFRTGDMLLFREDQDYDNYINCMFPCFPVLLDFLTTKYKYSRVAIIIRDPDFTDFPSKGLHVLESNYQDDDNANNKVNIKLEEFDKFMVTIKSTEKLYWRRLNCVRDDNFYNILKESYQSLINNSYDIIPLNNENRDDNGDDNGKLNIISKSLSASVIAYIYVKWDFLPTSTQYIYVTPQMLGTENNEKNKLKYSNCFIEKERQIL